MAMHFNIDALVILGSLHAAYHCNGSYSDADMLIAHGLRCLFEADWGAGEQKLSYVRGQCYFLDPR